MQLIFGQTPGSQVKILFSESWHALAERKISSFGTARASTVDRSAQKWQERAGRALARVYLTSKKSPI